MEPDQGNGEDIFLQHKEEGLMLGSSSLVTYYQPAAAWCGLEPCGAADLHPGA